MTKHIRVFLAAAFALCAGPTAQAAGGGGGGGPVGAFEPTTQMRSWLFGSTRLDFQAQGGPVVSTVPAITGATTTLNAVYDAAGQLMFYTDVTGMSVKDSNGNSAGPFGYAQSSTIMNDQGTALVSYGNITNEVAIVPVPGACKQFYIINHSIAPLSNLALLSTLVDCSSGTPVVSPTVILYEGYGRAGFAISRADAAGSRFLYQVLGGTIYRYPITSSGIGAAVTALTFPYGGYSYEVELSPDGTRLGFEGISSKTLYVADVTPSTGAVSNVTSKVLPTGATINGIEFSGDSKKLYASYSGSAATPGVAEWTLATSGFVSFLPGSTNYANTSLELAFDGLIYGITGSAATGQLGTLNPNTNAFALSPVTTQIARANGFHPQLPDQIDGENYAFFFGTPAPTITNLTLGGTKLYPGAGSYGSFTAQAYTCQALPLAATTTTVATYDVTVAQAQANGTLIPGGYQYTTASSAALPSDIRLLDNSYLATHPGYYMLTVVVRNLCGDVAQVKGFIQVISGVATASAIRFVSGQSGTGLLIPGTSASNATAVGTYGGGLDFSQITAPFNSYRVRIEEASTSALVAEQSFAVNGSQQLPPNFFKDIVSPFVGSYYFDNHLNTVYKLTLTLNSGSCGSDVTVGYFTPTTTAYRSVVPTVLAPNPVTAGGATLTYNLPRAQAVRVVVLDALSGKEVRVVVAKQEQSAGEHAVTVDASGLPAGVYLYKILGDGKVETGRFIVTN